VAFTLFFDGFVFDRFRLAAIAAPETAPITVPTTGTPSAVPATAPATAPPKVLFAARLTVPAEFSFFFMVPPCYELCIAIDRKKAAESRPL
jgi:hypothetical protein